MSDFRAKHHAVLDNLKKDLRKGFLDKEVVVQGTKFKLFTLNEDEETWADSYIRSSTPMVMISSRKAPRLAAAIRSINGVNLPELFSFPDDMPADTKKALNDNPVQLKYWYREQMLYFLAEDSIRPFINELYDALTALEEERAEAIKAIPK